MPNTLAPIRVLIVDEHPVYRQGLRRAFEEQAGLVVAGEAADGEEALRQAGGLQPDVVLLGIPMDGNVAAVRAIRALHPETRVIALSVPRNEDVALAALRAGASGFLLKDVAETELIEAIGAVYRNEAVLDAHLSARLLAELQRLDGGD